MLRRTTVLVGSFVVLAISMVLAADIQSPLGLSAEQIIERNIAARGGLQAWRAVQSLSMRGTMEAGGNDSPTRPVPAVRTGGVQLPKRPAQQTQLPFRLQMKRARKSRLEIDFRGETAVQVFDGTHGWKLRPFLNRHDVESFTPDEMKAVALQSDLDGPLVDYSAKGTKIELEGTEKVESQDAYRLKLTFKTGDARKVWIDANTFLEIKIEGTPRRLDGINHPVEIYYRDYRTVGRLKMPYLTETKVQGVKQTEKIEVEEIAVNARVEDSRFAKLQ